MISNNLRLLKADVASFIVQSMFPSEGRLSHRRLDRAKRQKSGATTVPRTRPELLRANEHARARDPPPPRYRRSTRAAVHPTDRRRGSARRYSGRRDRAAARRWRRERPRSSAADRALSLSPRQDRLSLAAAKN